MYAKPRLVDQRGARLPWALHAPGRDLENRLVKIEDVQVTFG